MRSPIALFLSFVFLLCSCFAFAGAPPPSFLFGPGKAVFVDFKNATYTIEFQGDLSQPAQVTTDIEFDQSSKGHPIFDLVPDVDSISIDGQATQEYLVNQQVRVAALELPIGPHHMQIKHSLMTNLYTWSLGRVGFWMKDTMNRGLLERYLPSNLEYDAVEMKFVLKFADATPRDIFTNGTVTKIDDLTTEVLFPAHFTSASPYFHLAPTGEFLITRFEFNSVDGRKVPGIYYFRRESGPQVVERILSELSRLESWFGPWPHPKVLYYGHEFYWGMEYEGASAGGNIMHEFAHSYFARGILPNDGNSEWIDEAFATWVSADMPTSAAPPAGVEHMGNQGIYSRYCPGEAYYVGSELMGWIHARLLEQGNGGVDAWFRQMGRSYLGKTITSREFQKSVEAFGGFSLKDEFDRLVYGVGEGVSKSELKSPEHDLPGFDRLHELLD